MGLLLLVLLVGPSAAQAQALPGSLSGLQLERIASTEGRVVFGIPVNATVTADGALLVVDMAEHQVLRVNTSGGVDWERGGAGNGPGEYELPYRVAVHDDGTVVVFDLQRQDFSLWDEDGTFVERERLPFPVEPLDGILALSDGRLAVAGRTNWGGAAADHGIHVFSREFEHLESFGPLPSIDPRKAGLWGVGSLSPASDGGMWLSSWGPFELFEYSADGVLRQRIPTVGGDPSLDRMVLIDEEGVRINDDAAIRLGRVLELGGRLHVTRTSPEGRFWDTYDGDWRAREAPTELLSVLVHPDADVLWVWRTTDLGEAIFEAYRRQPGG